MGQITLRPGDWVPDAGPIGHADLYKVNDAIPLSEGWVSFPTAVSETVAVATAPGPLYGIHIHETTSSDSPTWMLFAGTRARLLRGSDVADLTLVSADATVHTNCHAFFGWRFASFGDQVWAASKTNNLQYASTPTTDFVDGVDDSGSSVDSYQPKAAFVATLKQHLLIANITHAKTVGSFTNGDEKNQLVMWSAFDNPRRFGDEDLMLSYASADNAASVLTGSGWRNLSDGHGAITGLVSCDYFALIFKATKIVRMDGPPWQFNTIAEGVGTIHPNSIVKYGGDIYFLGADGPMVIRGGSSYPEPIGRGSVAKTTSMRTADWDDSGMALGDLEEYFMGMRSFTDLGHWGAVDSANGLIIWGGYSTSENTQMLVYNVEEERFGFAGGDDTNVSSGISNYPANATGTRIRLAAWSPTLRTRAVSVNGFDAQLSSTLGGIIFVDGRQYTNDFVRLLVPMDTATDDLATYRWSPAPYFEWPFIPLYAQNNEAVATRITRVRPVYDCAFFDGATLARTTKFLKCVVKVKTQSRFPDSFHMTTETYDPYVDTYQNPDGWIDISSSTFGTHHSISVQFFHPTGSGLVIDTPLTALARSLFELEVEYARDGSKYGSPYKA